ncbi:MAG: hypothetical protein H6727_09385 [Myxococcales bacterium]|nr:hypothetical protein [Myxococcales bacterium]
MMDGYIRGCLSDSQNAPYFQGWVREVKRILEKSLAQGTTQAELVICFDKQLLPENFPTPLKDNIYDIKAVLTWCDDLLGGA